MSSENDKKETSTFEMETKKNFDLILQAIGEMRQDFGNRLDKIETEQAEIRKEQAEMRKEFDEFKNFAEAQFEAIRQGLVQNYNQFDILVSEISQNRSVIFSTKAMVGELNEKIYLLTRSTEQALK
jgi:uncharacterized protein involved in exopolysaccharide biosynthesis